MNSSPNHIACLALGALALLLASCGGVRAGGPSGGGSGGGDRVHDLVIYGGTSAAIVAAVQAQVAVVAEEAMGSLLSSAFPGLLLSP